MGYLIDTNILSELQKGNRCHAGVQRWYAATDSNDLFLSVLVIGEIRQGIERLRRRDTIQSVRLEQKLLAVETLMAGRILPITVSRSHAPRSSLYTSLFKTGCRPEYP